MDLALVIGLGAAALALSFIAGLTFSTARQERVNRIMDCAMRELVARIKRSDERVGKLETLLKLSDD